MAKITNAEADSVSSQMIRSKDGTCISYQSIGTGPSLIIVPGALSIAHDFLPLATALANTFTTHIVERRGRGLSGEMRADYCIAKECEDIAAIQAQMDAHYLFGHSYGGLIALESARNNPALHKIAVYEPGVSIDQSVAVGWMPAYQAHLDKQRYREAFVEFVRYSGPPFMMRLPRWYLGLILRVMIKEAEWSKMVKLLPNNLLEHKEVARLDNTYQNYCEVAADVLLMAGGKSPKFREQTLQTLSGVLPKSEIKLMDKLDHFGPTQGNPIAVAQTLKAYFLK